MLVQLIRALAKSGELQQTAAHLVSEFNADENRIDVTATDLRTGQSTLGTYDFETNPQSGGNDQIV